MSLVTLVPPSFQRCFRLRTIQTVLSEGVSYDQSSLVSYVARREVRKKRLMLVHLVLNLKPNSDGLQPNSDGLQPNSNLVL